MKALEEAFVLSRAFSISYIMFIMWGNIIQNSQLTLPRNFIFLRKIKNIFSFYHVLFAFVVSFKLNHFFVLLAIFLIRKFWFNARAFSILSKVGDKKSFANCIYYETFKNFIPFLVSFIITKNKNAESAKYTKIQPNNCYEIKKFTTSKFKFF